AAEHSVLAGGGTRPQRRTVRGGVRPASRGGGPPRGVHRRGPALPQGRGGNSGHRGGADRSLSGRNAEAARRDPDPGDAGAGALLRRRWRDAAGAARTLRRARQPRLGARTAEEVLPELQLRVAGGRHRRRGAALTRTPALLPAGGGLPLPESSDRAGDPRSGDARLAHLPDPLAMGGDAGAHGAALAERATHAAA